MAKHPSQYDALVGIIGDGASGKDTVAKMFGSRGYQHVSASDLVRAEIIKRGQQPSRPLQTEIANELRQQQGNGYWVDLSVLQLQLGATKAVISGLYSPSEGQHIISKYAGFLVGVVGNDTDDIATRYERLRARSNDTRDALTYTEFVAAHERERGGTLEHETNVTALLAMAHFTIHNTAGLDYLEEQTLAVAQQIEGSDS